MAAPSVQERASSCRERRRRLWETRGPGVGWLVVERSGRIEQFDKDRPVIADFDSVTAVLHYMSSPLVHSYLLSIPAQCGPNPRESTATPL